MGLLIKPGCQPEVVTPANGKKFTLDEMQKLVGGYIEHIPFRWHKAAKEALPKNAKGKSPAQGWINEEGKLKGMLTNRAATILFDTQGDHFAGPVLLTYAGEA